MYHSNEPSHHLFTCSEVGDDTISQRSYGANVVVSLLIHHLSLRPYGNHFVCTTIKSNDRWLINHNLIITRNDGVGGAKIHCYFLDKRKKSHIICLIILQTIDE